MPSGMSFFFVPIPDTLINIIEKIKYYIHSHYVFYNYYFQFKIFQIIAPILMLNLILMNKKPLLLIFFSVLLVAVQAQVVNIKTFKECFFDGAKLLSNGKIIFAASDTTNSQTLWVTDGTTAGTKRIGLDCPGDPFDLFYPYISGGSHIGSHSDGNNYYGFMRTDCNIMYEWSFFKTDGDTVSYYDPSIYYRHNIDDNLFVGSKLYFFARPKKIYSYDKNTNIITLEHDTIDPHPSVNIDISFIAKKGDDLLLSFAKSSSYGNQLVRFNTTSKTLTYIFDFRYYYASKLQFGLPNPTFTYDHGPYTGYTPPVFTWNNSTYFFIKYVDDNNSNYYSLWKTDGTAAGTVELKSFKITLSQTNTDRGVSFIPYNGNLYFRFSNKTHSGLWKTDGTPAGTTLIKSLNIDTFNHSYNNVLTNLVELNGKLYFLGSDSNKDFELWESDGTISGTKISMKFLPGDVGLMKRNSDFHHIYKFNNRIYFLGNLLSPVKELITTDGTIEGTYSLGGNAYSGFETPIIKKDNELFFVSTGPVGNKIFSYLNKVDLDSAKPLFLKPDTVTAIREQPLTVTGFDLRNAVNAYLFHPADTLYITAKDLIQVNDTTVTFTIPFYTPFGNFKVAVATPQGTFFSQDYYSWFPLSVKENEAGNIHIFQTVDKITISLKSSETFEYQLIDISGRIVKQNSFNTTLILHKNHFLPGVYILRINNRSEKILIY